MPCCLQLLLLSKQAGQTAASAHALRHVTQHPPADHLNPLQQQQQVSLTLSLACYLLQFLHLLLPGAVAALL